MHPFSLTDKHILITGASSGIGKSIAVECAKMGAQLTIVGRNEKRLSETLNALEGKNHTSLIMDIADEEDMKRKLAEWTEEIDGIVHAAGTIVRLPFKFMAPEKFNSILQTNLVGGSNLIRLLYKKGRIRNNGSIVFISSIASDFASMGNIMYMASKGAVNSFAKGLAFELAKIPIRVNVIQPGMIKTSLTRAISDKEIEEDIARYPLGRYGKPEEVAYAAIYLLSDASAWTTGASIVVDGGITLR